MEFCGKNGLRCLVESVSACVLLITIVFACRVKKTPLGVGKQKNKSSLAFAIQMTLTLILCVESTVYPLLMALGVRQCSPLGYRLLGSVVLFLAWTISAHLLHASRGSHTRSCGSGRHFIAMWGVAVARESFTFVMLWKNHSPVSEVDFWCRVTRFACSSGLLAMGICGGYPKDLKNGDTGEDGMDVDEMESTRGEPSSGSSARRKSWQRIKTMAFYLWPRRSMPLQLLALFCLFVIFASRVVNVLIPVYSKKIVNSLTSWKNGSQREDESPWYPLELVIIFTILHSSAGENGLFSILRSLAWVKVRQNINSRIQLSVYTHLHELSLRWHLERKTGEILRIITRGSHSLNDIINYSLFQITPTLLDSCVAVVYFTVTFNYIFGIVILSSITLFLTCTFALTRLRTTYRRQMIQRENDQCARAVDSLLNFETVKYFGATKFEAEQYKHYIDRYQVAEWCYLKFLNALKGVQLSLLTLGRGGCLLMGAWAVVFGFGGLHLTVGDFILLITYLTQLINPLVNFGTFYTWMLQAFVDMEKLLDLMNEEVEVKDADDAVPLFVSAGNIELSNVSFFYCPKNQILKNISFKVPAGQTVALVGHTGCGKSTILRLLCRFYDVTSGVIKIDGQDISKCTRDSLRKAIGAVPQDSILFNQDIRYNIRYGRVLAREDEVEEAARAADIHQRILAFPQGYETVVGERGLKLSGGEKQRVAIARTFLQAPRIVLLDEATSSLDTKTERSILQSLSRLCQNRTTVIVAHRLSTVVHADQILVLKEGEIIEHGTHKELLRLRGRYAELWKQQLSSSRTDDRDDDREDDKHCDKNDFV